MANCTKCKECENNQKVILHNFTKMFGVKKAKDEMARMLMVAKCKKVKS